MEIQCHVRIHSGGRRCFEAFTITVTVPVAAAAGVRTVSRATLAERFCERLDAGYNRLLPENVRFAHVQFSGWEPLVGDTVVLEEEQQQLHIDVMVVPTASGPGFALPPVLEVRLIDLVAQPIPWFGSTSTSHSSTDISYTDMKIHPDPWAPPDVTSFLTEKLGERVLRDCDVRQFFGQISTRTLNEDELNTEFQTHVCKLVVFILSALGLQVHAHRNIESQNPGKPDFLFTLENADNIQEVLTGEGQTPSMVEAAERILPGQACTVRPAKQIAYYMKKRGHSYGFYTYAQGTFCVARVDRHTYAFTPVIPWHKEGEGVVAYLTYMVLKQLAIMTENKKDEGIWVPPKKQQWQPLYALPPGLGGAAGSQSSPSAVAAAPAAAAPAAAVPVAAAPAAAAPATTHEAALALCAELAAPAAANSVQHSPGASLRLGTTVASNSSSSSSSSSSSTSSSTIVQLDTQYLQLEEDDLYLSDIVVGRSQSGAVKLGMLKNNGIWCAVKLADAHKQKREVDSMKHECKMYRDGRLAGLQGEVLPVHVACGYWDEGNIFFSATTYLDSCKKPGGSTKVALPAAEQALRRLHSQGLLHGDIHEDNVLLRQVSADKWQAFLIDLGMCCEATHSSQFEEEMRSLRQLFGKSGSGSAESTGRVA